MHQEHTLSHKHVRQYYNPLMPPPRLRPLDKEADEEQEEEQQQEHEQAREVSRRRIIQQT